MVPKVTSLYMKELIIKNKYIKMLLSDDKFLNFHEYFQNNS